MPDPLHSISRCIVVAPAPAHAIVPIATQDAALIAAFLATCGWLYTARKARASVRKQHTINVIMAGEFNDTFRCAEKLVPRT